MAQELHTHVLRRNSPDLNDILSKVLALSNEIFGSDPTTKYASLSYWKERLSHESSIIIYLTAHTQVVDSTADKPVAFLFAHPRAHSPPLEDGTSETLHIWLAGVLPEWRKGGCLQSMVKEVMKDPGTTYTICTTPSKFPNMWSWLLKRRWRRERDYEEGKVMLSKHVEAVQ